VVRARFSSRLTAVLTFLAAISGPAPSAAPSGPQAPAAGERPRIGLALGGGSARGLAHVGVLEWLDEHRIPIDAVAGTSMGGLIGGSFATGIPATELRRLTSGTDWDAVLSTDAPFEDATFRRKQDRRAFPAGLEFGVRRGLWLPRSLNPGQRIALLIDRITLPYSALPTFDDLPTPFRCVAFDIDRSESVVLGRGILAEAMRATMALPGIFPPVTIDGRLLVDGGFLDNVPVEAARQMNVDVVIAVDVTRSPAATPEVTAFSMLSRAVDAVMAHGARRNLASADVVITPDIANLDSTDWNQVDAWRRRGYEAAEARAADLLKYAVSQAAYDAHQAARQARRRMAPVVPSAIRIIGVGAAEQATFRRQLSARAGRPLEISRLEQDLLRLSGTDRYELLSYHLVDTASGTQLEIVARPKANGPAFLTLGLSLNNTDATNFAMSVEGRTTIYDVAGAPSEVRLDFAVGTLLHVGGELYRPVAVPWLFAAPRAYVSSNQRNLFIDDSHVAEYRFTRVGAGADIGVSFGRLAELRAGADIAHVEDSLKVGSPHLPEAEGDERTASVRFTFDGQDSPVVPSRGVRTTAAVRRFFSAPVATGEPAVVGAIQSPQEFWQAEFDATMFNSLTRRNRLFFRVAAGTSFDAEPYFNAFSLGGPFRMSAYLGDQLRGAHFALGGAGYMRQLPRLPSWVGGQGYVAVWVEGGSAFQSRSTADWRGDIAAGVILDSNVGPVFVGGSVGPDGHRRFYVSLGTLFR
jgi:NTE family protein